MEIVESQRGGGNGSERVADRDLALNFAERQPALAACGVGGKVRLSARHRETLDMNLAPSDQQRQGAEVRGDVAERQRADAKIADRAVPDRTPNFARGDSTPAGIGQAEREAQRERYDQRNHENRRQHQLAPPGQAPVAQEDPAPDHGATRRKLALTETLPSAAGVIVRLSRTIPCAARLSSHASAAEGRAVGTAIVAPSAPRA